MTQQDKDEIATKVSTVVATAATGDFDEWDTHHKLSSGLTACIKGEVRRDERLLTIPVTVFNGSQVVEEITIRLAIAVLGVARN